MLEPMLVSQSNSHDAISSTADPLPELLGAVDIVEAFTVLRHELKLQVRNGRELQQSLVASLQQIEQRIASQNTVNDSQSSSESRRMVEAIIEIEESLQRALDSLKKSAATKTSDRSITSNFDELVSNASWLTRKFAGRLLSVIRASLENASAENKAAENSMKSTYQGFELLLARIHRQMKQCEIERMNVLQKPFDAELMNAIDRIDSVSVPSTHVAEQLRPAYLWRGEVIRYAEVRLAK